MQEFKKIHSVCKNCCFATYADKTQTGCRLDRIENYRKQNSDSIVEARDDELEFYIIDGRDCNAFRDKNGKWPGADKTERVQLKMVHDEISLRVTYLINIWKYDSINNVENTAKQILAGTTLPYQVIFVNRSDYIQPKELSLALREILGDKITWRISTIIDKSERWEQSVDSVIGVVSGGFYTTWTTSCDIPKDFIPNLNKAVNQEMRRFSVLKPLNRRGDGLTVQTMMHTAKAIGGNIIAEADALDGSGTVTLHDVVEKVQYYAECKEMPYLVDEVSSLWS